MQTFVIETGIPVPPRANHAASTRGRGLVGALRRLSEGPVGASIFVSGKAPGVVASAVTTAAGRGWATTRKVDGGVRVWKIAEPKQADEAPRSKAA